MKLYSRFQVIVITAITSVSIIAICLSLFAIISLNKKAQNYEEDVADENISIIEEKTYSDTPVFEFKTSTSEQIKKTDFGGYTQDEVQNISVYETCKDAVVNITTEVVAINW